MTKVFNLQVAVNLSVRQFQEKNLAETIIGIIEETGFDPTYLNLEVTESSIMKNPDSAVERCRTEKKSALKSRLTISEPVILRSAYLKRLPIDILKIDKSFINDVTINPDDAALVMTIITLAHNLNLKVVAEGVETEEQLNFLHRLKCDEWQGYLYSRPVPTDDFRKLLAERSN